MKLVTAIVLVLATLGASLAWAQQCRPGQSVRCEKDPFGSGYTCRCTW